MKKLFFTLLLVALSVTHVYAEDVLYPERSRNSNLICGFDGITPISFIIEGGANVNMYSGTVNWNTDLMNSYNNNNMPAIPLAANPVIDDIYGSAMGFGPHFAFGIDVPINSKIGFAVRIGWDRKYVSSEASGEFQLNDLSGGYTSVMNSWEKKMDYANYSIDFRYNILERLSLNLGATIDVVSRDKENVHWESLDFPLNQTSFNPSMPSWVDGMYYDEDRTTDNPLTKDARVGLELGLDYKIPILERFTIVPYVRFQYFFTKLMDDRKMVPTDTAGKPVYGDNEATNWMYSVENTAMHTLQVGVALWFNFEKGGKK